jgi:O-antigen/teichoic acid export membrane protein
MGLEKDKLLMKIGLKIAALNILANLFGVFYLGIKGAVIVFVISSFLIFILKKKAAKNYFTKYDWKN